MSERCRICLKKHQDVISLRMRKKVSGIDVSIADQIKSLAHLDVLEYGSKMICRKCADKAHRAYKFLQDCKKSTEVLQQESKMLPVSKLCMIKPQLKDPDIICIETNCNQKSDIEIGNFTPEAKDADIVFIENLSPKHAIHDEVTEQTTQDIREKCATVETQAATFSCEYCPKKYKQRPAYLCHLSQHRANKGKVGPSAPPRRPMSQSVHEGLKKVRRKPIVGHNLKLLNGDEATLDEQAKPLSSQEKTNAAQTEEETALTVANGEKATSEPNAPPKPPKNQDKSFPCSICLRTFTRRSTQLTHERTHRGPYACRFCDQVPQTLKDMVQHQREAHISEARFICDTCGKAFFKETNLQRHRDMHAGIKPHMCDMCGSAFTIKRNLVDHIRSHTGEKKYTCFRCGKAFVQVSSLRAHEDVHNEEKKYACELCGAQYFRADGLRKHKREKHAERKNIFPCDICSKQFQLRAQYKRHMLHHTGERRHICSTCGKRFLKRWNLKVHERVHTMERPFKCELCDKTFTQAHSLRSHLALHAEKERRQSEASRVDMQEGEPGTEEPGAQDDVGSDCQDNIL